MLCPILARRYLLYNERESGRVQSEMLPALIHLKTANIGCACSAWKEKNEERQQNESSGSKGSGDSGNSGDSGDSSDSGDSESDEEE